MPDASPAPHPKLDTAQIAIATDELISFWQYRNGEYELDEDIWGLDVGGLHSALYRASLPVRK
jgi:hypothetical protein